MTGEDSSGGRYLPLAVYGTLRRGDRNHHLLGESPYLGSGEVEGVLRHVPAAPTRPYGFPVLLPAAAGRVTVELYRLARPELMVALDKLENYDPAREAESEFLRRTVRVFDGPVDEAEVYVYNGPTEVLGDVIGGGDWMAFEGRAVSI